MVHHHIQEDNRQIRFVTNLGIAGNIILAVAKVVFGLLGGSAALVADGVHSISDMATDIALLLGVYFGSKKPDETHPYGHGRIETLATVFIGGVLAVVGAGMIYQAASDIAEGTASMPGIIILWVAIASVIVKEIMYRITKKVAVQTHSPALYANAWHHRSDALSSIAVIIGFISIELGFIFGDELAAVAVGLMVLLVAVHIIIECIRELIESAVDTKTIGRIKQIVNSNDQIRGWHKLRTRMVGREVFLDLHILVEPSLNINEAHKISEHLENALQEQITRPVNIIVHIEPDVPALRK